MPLSIWVNAYIVLTSEPPMKYCSTLSLACLMIICLSCGNNKQQSQNSDTVSEREPTDNEIREYGILTSIEDAPYPMFSIDVEFPEREMSMSFSFNVEESSLDMEALMAMKGKYATMYYVIEDDPQIESIVKECEPVWGEINPDSNGIKEITGVLSGASAVSGDLPGILTITTRDGTVMEFEHFIEDAVVAVNDEEVTIFYYEHYMNKITYLKASED